MKTHETVISSMTCTCTRTKKKKICTSKTFMAATAKFTIMRCLCDENYFILYLWNWKNESVASVPQAYGNVRCIIHLLICLTRSFSELHRSWKQCLHWVQLWSTHAGYLDINLEFLRSELYAWMSQSGHKYKHVPFHQPLPTAISVSQDPAGMLLQRNTSVVNNLNSHSVQRIQSHDMRHKGSCILLPK